MNEKVNVEYKSEYTEDIKKTVIAFLNTSGGKIYVGIDDNSNVIGLDNPDEVSLSLISSIRDNIVPDSTMFLQVKKEQMEGKNIVIAEVVEGTSKPYYIYQKGMKPSGVFVRVDSATVPATQEHIKRLISLSDNTKFIEQRSLNQELTFVTAQEFFDEANVKFETGHKITLGIQDKDNQYTNLGLLLSDQCTHSIKVAVFEGTSKMTFKTRREFTGSIFKQMKETIEFLELFNNVRAEISGLKRKETKDYDPAAIREALLNAVIHRDYTFTGSTLVNVYDDRIEFVNHGGLVRGISIESIILGITESRNEKLANIFYRLEYVEAYGTGIPRIYEVYSNNDIKPSLNVTDSSFMITLPNMSYVNKLNSKDEEIIEFIKIKGEVTRKDIENRFNIGSTRAFDILKKLEDSKVIMSKKIGKKKLYFIK